MEESSLIPFSLQSGFPSLCRQSRNVFSFSHCLRFILNFFLKLLVCSHYIRRERDDMPGLIFPLLNVILIFNSSSAYSYKRAHTYMCESGNHEWFFLWLIIQLASTSPSLSISLCFLCINNSTHIHRILKESTVENFYFFFGWAMMEREWWESMTLEKFFHNSTIFLLYFTQSSNKQKIIIKKSVEAERDISFYMSLKFYSSLRFTLDFSEK